MGNNTYDRYSMFRSEGAIQMVPFIKLKPKSSDCFEIYKLGVSRLDLISNKYYGNPNYDWLIMTANPEYGSLEYNIPDGVELRVPFPLDITLQEYSAAINEHEELY